MKKKALLLLIPFLLVTACDGGSGSEGNPNIRQVKVYNLLGDYEEGRKKEDLYLLDTDLLFKGDDTYVPYITFESYFDCFKPLLKAKFKFQYSEKNGRFSIQTKYSTETLLSFVANYNNEIFTIYEGDISNALNTSQKAERSSLMIGIGDNYEEDYVSQSSGYMLPYDGIKDRVVIKDEKYYYPLSVVSYIAGIYTGFELFYNYEDLFLIDLNTEDTEFGYLNGDKEETPFSRQKSIVVSKELSSTPQNVAYDRYFLYEYIFKHFCGLRESRGLDVDKIIADAPISRIADTDKRAAGAVFKKLSGALGDLHTAFFNSPWDVEEDVNVYNSQVWTKISEGSFAYNIRTLREYDEDTILYSSNGKAALVFLDSFANICYGSKDKPASEYTLDELASEDDVFHLRKQLETVKNKGGVEKVIIDISINGGGLVANLLKILSLIAKDNNPVEVSLKNTTYDSGITVRGSIDSNLDGELTLDDVYGDDFEIFIMSSAYSFSCGNAFPFVAKNTGLATIIGNTSGGGECCVYAHYMPSGEAFYYSSPLHIGLYKKGTFYGAEEGGIVEENRKINPTDAERYNLDHLLNGGII